MCAYVNRSTLDLLCMLYLIVISANRKREAHQQAMPGSQWLGEAHVDDLIGTCWRGALPLLKKVQTELILKVQRRFLFAGKSIIIPRCGDLYFHLLLHY